jgi:predicted HicB family RNase H-like nuclease
MHGTTFSLSIDISLKERLHEVSKKSNISMAKLIEELLKEDLPQYEKKYQLQQKIF